jgi:hypothetical protein
MLENVKNCLSSVKKIHIFFTQIKFGRGGERERKKEKNTGTNSVSFDDSLRSGTISSLVDTKKH